ncbi:MAG: T9SS type A sorting domain-containing protein [Bacteroidota bacterium]
MISKSIKYYLKISAFLWVFGQFSFGQVQMVNTSGTNFSFVGSPILTLDDVSLINEGTITSDQETYNFVGESATVDHFLNGASGFEIYTLSIDKSSNGISVLTNLTINNQIDFVNGTIELDGADIEMNGANLNNESETSRILGNPGSVFTTLDLNAPSAVNPSNLGFEFEGETDLGTTGIVRSHGIITLGANESIERQIEISATNDEIIILKFFYLDAELNGIDENELTVFRDTGSGYEALETLSRDTDLNFVEVENVSVNGIYTLADSETLSVVNNQLINYSVFPNPFEDKIAIQFSENSPNREIKIFDLFGRMVNQSNLDHEPQNQIDLSHLQNGVYLLVPSQDEKALNAVKIIKSK